MGVDEHSYIFGYNLKRVEDFLKLNDFDGALTSMLRGISIGNDLFEALKIRS